MELVLQHLKADGAAEPLAPEDTYGRCTVFMFSLPTGVATEDVESIMLLPLNRKKDDTLQGNVGVTIILTEEGYMKHLQARGREALAKIDPKTLEKAIAKGKEDK